METQEINHFNDTMKTITDELEDYLSDFDELKVKYMRDPAHYGVAYRLACENIKILKSGIIKPYFGRIDFLENNNLEKLYIGKYGIHDSNEKSIVIDWRAPIASLYYDSNLGKTSYDCLDGTITGDLLLKRQYDIEDGKLLNYYDVDIVSNDLLLEKYLKANNDLRLKNIVATIQTEQNYAVRRPININTIIQGVAGSGKTTIALHRLAYLIYNHKNYIKNSQYIVIGPNDVFLKYIKSVLPDLDVDGVNQETYEQLALDILDEQSLLINPSSKKLNMYVTGKLTNDIPKFKNSDDYMVMLDLFFEDYCNNLINKDFVINSTLKMDKKDFKEHFLFALKIVDNYEAMIERLSISIRKYVEEKTRYIESENKSYKQQIRKVLPKSKFSAVKMYKEFLKNIDKYDVSNYEYLSQLSEETLKNLSNNCADFEDLPALLYLKNKVGINKMFKEYRHVVIDEAQDLGKFSFNALKNCLPNATFSIYGDITQSIYDYRSIDSWDEIRDIFPNHELISFRKSYRTTDEIMEVANAVSQHLNLEQSELSIRHGEKVSFSQVESNNIPNYINDKIREYIEKGYKTIAVISKYPTQSNYINDDLSMLGLYVTNIDERTDLSELESGVMTVPNYLSKGLEFDAVIINDASENIYKSDNQLDMKMLYVSLTRALHEMDVVYSNEISKPLRKFANKEKILIKE